MKDQLRTYVVAYFDILGYRQAFKDQDFKPSLYLEKIKSVCNDVFHKAEWFSKELNTNFVVKTFSDNFVIMLEVDNLFTTLRPYLVVRFFCSILQELQRKFIREYKVLLRGGLTVGEAYIDNDIVFGEPLIRSVELEEKKAVYPRIILDYKALEPQTNGGFDESTIQELCYKGYVKQDSDGLFYVDYFSDAYSLQEIRESVIELVNKNCKFRKDIKQRDTVEKRAHVIRKYAWVLLKYNEAFKLKKDKLEYSVILNQRLLEYELAIK